MSLSPGRFPPSNLTDLLKTIVDVKQTGYLKVRDGENQGCVAIENGVILHAQAGRESGLHALFQFVGWREARFEFQERPVKAEGARDLAVYDPEVLITGIAFKVDEQNLLHDAIPAVDAVVRYVGGDGLASVEVSPSDLKMLSLADGKRTVREIGDRSGIGALETARQLARFRMAGVLEVVDAGPGGKPAKLAAAG